MSGLGTTLYSLCFLTSAGCSLLLIRSFLRSRTRLLLWCAVCFVLLALNNLFLVIDLLVLPSYDLSPIRVAASLSAVSVLLFGFIWELD